METPAASEIEAHREESTYRVIPKFSSFKPVKEPSPPPLPDLQEHNDKKKEDRHRSRKHRKPRSNSEERRRDKDGGRNSGFREGRRGKDPDGQDREGSSRHHRDRERRHRSPRPSSKNTSVIEVKKSGARSASPESWDAPEKQYFTDTRGDPHNITYGTIHRYSVPDYRRHGSGCIVGLSPEIKIDRDKGDGKGIVLRLKKDRLYTGTGKNARYVYAKGENEGIKVLRIRKEGEPNGGVFENEMDFVPISSTGKGKKRKKHPDSGSEISGGEEEEEEEEEDNHYRSIEGLKKSKNNPEDRDLEYASPSDSDSDYISSREWNDQRKNVELIKKIDAEPRNIESWMEYINHQDVLLTNSGRRSTAAERASTAEIKLDILSKALAKCPGDERLLVKYMDVAETIWDSRRLQSKWQQVLKDNPTIIRLWTKYINFRQTDFQSFTYPECIKCFSECLAVLRSAVFRADKVLGEKLEEIILYVFLRLSLFMREAGYVGNAVAAFQSMLELNFFCPMHLTPPATMGQHDKLLEELEKFWDSEVLRIGETGAAGWASYTSSGGNGDVPDTRTENITSEPLDPRDPFGSWLRAEEERMGLPIMPARTIDEVEEDDPYRVVLFSDLRAFMFCFSSPLVKRKIADSFLLFSGLAPIYHMEPMSSSSPESTDTFLRNDLATMQESYLEEWFWAKSSPGPAAMTMDTSMKGLSMEAGREGGLADGGSFKFGFRNFPVGPDSLANGGSENWAKRVKGVDVGFVGRTIKTLVDCTEEEGLATYYLVWVWRNQPENVRKVAKALLKKSRTSLLLWNAYAQIEWRCGKIDSARNIFSTALEMSKGFPEEKRRDAVFLWKTWAWEELGEPSQMVRILLSVESGKLLPEDEHGFSPKNIQPALLLKSTRYLEEQQNLMTSMGYMYHAIVYNDIRALLEYLSHGQDIIAVLPVYDSLIKDFERRNLTGPYSTMHEFCLMSKARLLHHHATTARIFKMKIMRDVLEQALACFPNNSVFLELYAWNEGRTKIENKVRMLIRDVVLREDKETVVGWAFAVWAELRMVGMSEGYNVHAVRALLEKAVGCERTKSNIGLWMVYIGFELRENELKRAKEVLFRGIRFCPWSKDLALLAFQRLRPALDFEEMRKILSIISSEKELRVHDTTELEDMIEDMTETQRDRLSGSEQFLRLPDDDSDEMRDEE